MRTNSIQHQQQLNRHNHLVTNLDKTFCRRKHTVSPCYATLVRVVDIITTEVCRYHKVRQKTTASVLMTSGSSVVYNATVAYTVRRNPAFTGKAEQSLPVLVGKHPCEANEARLMGHLTFPCVSNCQRLHAITSRLCCAYSSMCCMRQSRLMHIHIDHPNNTMQHYICMSR